MASRTAPEFGLIANPRAPRGFSSNTAPRAPRGFKSNTAPRAPRGLKSVTAPRPARGFTLIEILVVIVILAVLAGAVSLAIAGAGGDRMLAREAERAQALLAYACEQAELGGRTIGISLSKSGYRFSHAEQEVWLPYKDGELRARHWPPPLVAALRRDDVPVQLVDDFPEKPQLLCFASGELTPFRLDLGWAEVERHYHLDAHADGAVELAAIDPRAH